MVVLVQNFRHNCFKYHCRLIYLVQTPVSHAFSYIYYLSPRYLRIPSVFLTSCLTTFLPIPHVMSLRCLTQLLPMSDGMSPDVSRRVSRCLTSCLPMSYVMSPDVSRYVSQIPHAITHFVSRHVSQMSHVMSLRCLTQLLPMYHAMSPDVSRYVSRCLTSCLPMSHGMSPDVSRYVSQMYHAAGKQLSACHPRMTSVGTSGIVPHFLTHSSPTSPHFLTTFLGRGEKEETLNLMETNMETGDEIIDIDEKQNAGGAKQKTGNVE